MRHAFLLGLTLCALPAAAAEFQGELEMKILTDVAAKGGWTGGTVRILVSPAGMRSELVAQTAKQPFQMVSLVRAAEPNVTYTLDVANKTYQKFDNATPPENPGSAPPTLKRLGTDRLLGRSVQHVLLTSAALGKQQELWIDTSLVPPARFVSAFDRNGGDAWWSVLRAAGLEGLPLKMLFRSTSEGSKETGVVALRVEAKPLPASTFDIPEGYREAKGPLDGPPP